MTSYETPGEFIRARRQALGWSLQAFADRVGVSFALAGYWERDQKPTAISYCRAIARALDLTDEEREELILLAQKLAEDTRLERSGEAA